MSGFQKYEGSREERNIKKAFELLEYDFGNLVIESCNVLKPVSFSNADVVTQPLSNEVKFDATDHKNYTIVRYGQLFKRSLINDVTSHGIGNLDEEYEPVFLAILNFLREITYHEEALYSIRGVRDEARMAAVLAQHLFCHLTPGKEYLIDSRSKDLPRHCPCDHKDCRQILKTGCTALGSPETWHGFADIILNRKIAVSVLEKFSIYEDEDYDDVEEVTSSLPEEDDDTEEEGPSEPKRSCTKDTDAEKEESPSNTNRLALSSSSSSTCSSSNISICIKVKAKRLKNTLSNICVIDQIIAQTITNAFSQVNETSALSGWLIPTLGCTMDHVVVFLYDPENDILLECFQKIPLWCGPRLYIPSIVQIWMFVNFTVFTCKNLADEYELDCSNFHTLAKHMLEDYKNMKWNRDFKFSYESEIHDLALQVMQRVGKTAVKKRKGKTGVKKQKA